MSAMSDLDLSLTSHRKATMRNRAIIRHQIREDNKRARIANRFHRLNAKPGETPIEIPLREFEPKPNPRVGFVAVDPDKPINVTSNSRETVFGGFRDISKQQAMHHRMKAINRGVVFAD